MLYYSTLYSMIMGEPTVTAYYGSQVLSWSYQRQQELGLYPAVLTTPVYNKYRQTTSGYTMTYVNSSSLLYNSDFGYEEYYFQVWTIVDLTGTSLEYSTAGATTQSTVQDVYTVVSTDINIYGSSTPPATALNNTSGWYFRNATGSQNINWLLYTNSGTSGTQTFGNLTTIWAILEINVTTSNPYFIIYSKPTGSGDVDPNYHSIWQYDDYLVVPPTPGKYLMYWGEDPNIRLDLPRINITQVQGPISAGDRSITENLAYINLVTDNAGVGNQEFTIMSTGYIIAGKVAVTNYVAL